jgi:hypothetical protein
LGKDPVTKQGRCGANPSAPCHLKRHTELLKRYGHFGKMPTSAALVLREAGVRGLRELRQDVLRRARGRATRSRALEDALTKAWRINEKIAAMFLSGVTNPDLSRNLAPWTAGVDWTYFVVIDSNVDLFLASIRYAGPWTYGARRAFVAALARGIDLRALDRRVRRYNPRLVQQAMYVFMSAANRRAMPADCIHIGPSDLRGMPTSAHAAVPGAEVMQLLAYGRAQASRHWSSLAHAREPRSVSRGREPGPGAPRKRLCWQVWGHPAVSACRARRPTSGVPSRIIGARHGWYGCPVPRPPHLVAAAAVSAPSPPSADVACDRMPSPKPFLGDGMGTVQQRQGSLQITEAPQHGREVQQNRTHVRMVGADRLLGDRERSHQQRPCAVGVPHRMKQQRQVRQARRYRYRARESAGKRAARPPGGQGQAAGEREGAQADFRVAFRSLASAWDSRTL